MLYDNEEVQASDLLDVAEATGDDPLVSTRIELPDHCNYKYLLHLQGAPFFLHDAVEHHGHATCIAVPCLTAAHAPAVRAASICMPLRLLLDATPLVGAGNTYATRLKWLMACGSVILFPVDKEYFHQAGIGSSLHGAPHLTLGLP